MRYVFGPVPSRRLGRSLGVDPVAFKTCNWNCVYCQLGRRAPLRYERREYVPAEEVVRQVVEALTTHPRGMDWITFGGSGEPTLNSALGRMIRELKQLTEVTIAVLTNGALLYRPEVRVDLLGADAVLPSLDAGNEEVFRRINRPRPELTFARLVEGLCAFRRVYSGQLWIEVMLVAGVNDSDAALQDLAAVMDDIRPDEVHLNRPVRPPAEPWVEPASDAALERARELLGPRARVVAAAAPSLELAGDLDGVREAMLEILSRHPMNLEELGQALERWSPGEVGRALSELARSGRVRTVARMGREFWAAAEARYGVSAEG